MKRDEAVYLFGWLGRCCSSEWELDANGSCGEYSSCLGKDYSQCADWKLHGWVRFDVRVQQALIAVLASYLNQIIVNPLLRRILI